MREAAVLSYGARKLWTVEDALTRLGARVGVVDRAEAVAAAERLILPGVGQAGWAMARLRALGLVGPIGDFPRPLLGVCLGQQLLFEASEEGDTPLLGLIPGRVRRLRPGGGRTVPHMGWSRLQVVRDDPLLEGLDEASWAYFVHGFVCPDGPATLARADYGDPVPAVVRAANRWGCQFHPERSSETGARILRNFLELPA